MGLTEYEDRMKINCSSLINYKGKEVFLVNISVVMDDDSIRYCGIQLPDAYVSYCHGFTQKDLDELTEYVKDNEETLRIAASQTPPIPEDATLEELDMF